MEGKKQQRAGANEATIRNVNERIERGQWPGEEEAPLGFRCECGRLGCNRVIELSVREYEEIREHPKWFVVVSGHQTPDVERVVDARSGYLIVEKRGQAGEIAEERNPRD